MNAPDERTEPDHLDRAANLVLAVVTAREPAYPASAEFHYAMVDLPSRGEGPVAGHPPDDRRTGHHDQPHAGRRREAHVRRCPRDAVRPTVAGTRIPAAWPSWTAGRPTPHGASHVECPDRCRWRPSALRTPRCSARAPMALKMASNAAVNLASRSRMRNRNRRLASSRSMSAGLSFRVRPEPRLGVSRTHAC